MSTQILNYLSCRIGREWYGIDVNRVVRVMHLVALTQLPDTPLDVLGLLTMGDMVVPVIDLRRRFNLSNANFELETPIIVVDTPYGTIGLVVDDADDIENILAHQVTPYTGAASRYISSVAKQKDRLLLLLDIQQLGAEVQASEEIMEAVASHQEE